MKIHVDSEADNQSDLVNFRTSMGIALLLVGAMISPYAPLLGLGVELAAAVAIIAVRRPWADRRVSPRRSIDEIIGPHTASAPQLGAQPKIHHSIPGPDRSPNSPPHTRMVPVFDVGADRIVGLQTTLYWGSLSKSVLRSVASADLDATADTNPWVSALIGNDDLADGELLAKIDLMLRASNLEPERLLLEIEGWHESRKNRSTIDRLLSRGVSIGLRMSKGGSWPSTPKSPSSIASIYSVSASDITHQGELTLDGMANVETFSGTRLDRVVVRDVNHSSLALDLGSVGLKLQAGSIHGEAMDMADMTDWLVARHV